jgi:ABC-type branched-subunit amino acid transport system substrate-binding protein
MKVNLSAIRKRFPILSLALAVIALALLALACDDEEEEEGATPTPPVAETPAETPTEEATPGVTPTEIPLGPGAAGISSNPRDVTGLEGVFALDDGLAVFKERPADDDRTGVTADSIKICQTLALSGPAAVFYTTAIKQSDEFIGRINEVAGGIHGRKIELITRDDAYTPPVAVQAWKELVESDECFASFGMSGAAQLAANVDFLAANNVPSIQAQTGNTEFCEPTDPLLFCTGIPPFFMEAFKMGEYVLSQRPDAKIALVTDITSFGAILREGVEAAVGADQIVADIAYEPGTPDVTPHAVAAAESEADYLLILTNIPSGAIIKALRETAGSDMKVVVLDTTIMSAFFKNAAGSENFDGTVGYSIFPDPEATDTATTKYRALLEEADIGTAHGWQGGVFSTEYLVRALELAGPDLTREGLIEAIELGFDGSWTCSVCLGPTVFGPQDHWAIETLQLITWSDAEQAYLRIGDPISIETSEGNGLRGNFEGYECSADLPCPWKEGQ